MKTEKVSSTTSLDSKSQKGTHPCQKQLPQMGNSRLNMGVLLQGFFKHLPNNAVSSPADGDASIEWWWDHLARQANALRLVGFTAIWLPSVLKAYFGAGEGLMDTSHLTITTSDHEIRST